MQKRPFQIILCLGILTTFLLTPSCLPPSTPYPYRSPVEVVAEAEAWSESFEAYIKQWAQGLASDSIPDALIPKGISDCKNFYLKNPEAVTDAETWAVRFARPINKDSLLAGIPDPKITYLYLGTALAPFGSKLVLEGEFPHCRFFSIQITPPLNGSEYYAQRQFGAAEVALVDADIEPISGHTNPFRPGANRNANNRKFRVEFNLATGDPTSLNPEAHIYPFRKNTNTRTGAMLVNQGPLGFKTVAGTPLPVQGDWDLGALWVRIYEPDNGTGPLGGVAMPKVWFELPDGTKYFVGSDFSALQIRADKTIANRVVDKAPNPNFGPTTGWYKSWEISRNILNGICQSNGWSRRDSGARVRDIALGWTGRGEFQSSPSARIEPHATTNNYISYIGRGMTVPPGMVAVLTGKLPTFPSTRNGEPVMSGGDVRYWSICGIDVDALSPLPATTIHAICDDDVVIDTQRNYVIAYSRQADRPGNATSDNGVSWVDWGTQSDLGILMRWLCIAPDWRFPLAPQEHNMDYAHSEWSASLYDSTLIGVNWRNGFMECYLPKVHYLTKAEFEALGDNLTAEKIPVWVDSTYKIGPSEALLGSISVSSVLDNSASNAPSNANDGDFTSAWSSAFGSQNASITADLGSPKVISAIKLYWDWVFFAKNYTIEYSTDNFVWTTLNTATNENGQIDLYKNIQHVKARYVRLNLTEYNAGWYRLAEFEVYTNDCNCNATTVSDIEPKEENASLRLFPNPVKDILNYKIDRAVSVQLSVYDLNGRRLKVFKQQNLEGTIDLGDLPVGVYLLEVTDGQKWSKTKKIVRTN